MRVLVAHPGLQHAHRLAEALFESGDLLAFRSGIPLVMENAKAKGWGRLSRGLRTTVIPEGVRRHHPAFPVAERLAGRVFDGTTQSAVTHRLDHAFDRWMAPRVGRLKPDLVVCYENAALEMFRAAKSIGAVCVLDAASIHFKAQTERLVPTDRRNPDWVNAHKQAEIDAADAIITCSPFAAETYAAAGVALDKLFVCPLGVDLAHPQPSPVKTGRALRFVFVGALRPTKGVDFLLDIFEGLQREGVQASLTFIGGAAEPSLVRRIGASPAGFVHLAFMPQQQLLQELAGYDCLLLPSRFDSFGMVVPEAMSVGVPVVISDQVGAKCILDSHPGAGWVVPLDPGLWSRKLVELIANRSALNQASVVARAAATDFTWDAYRNRVRELLRTIYENHRAIAETGMRSA